MMVYLKADVFLSVDVFERFRTICLDYYGVGPCYTYFTPGLTLTHGLKHIDVRFKYYKEETVTFMI